MSSIGINKLNKNFIHHTRLVLFRGLFKPLEIEDSLPLDFSIQQNYFNMVSKLGY